MDKIKRPESIAILIAKRHFPFLFDYFVKTNFASIMDIKQIGWLCALENNFDYKNTYNAIQRELYRLAKTCGFRRNKLNQWRIIEVDTGFIYKNETEEV